MKSKILISQITDRIEINHCWAQNVHISPPTMVSSFTYTHQGLTWTRITLQTYYGIKLLFETDQYGAWTGSKQNKS